MNLNWAVSILLALALGLSGYAVLHLQQVQTAPQQVGSVPVLPNPLCVNGVCEFFISQPFRLATSTACDIKTPNATTTLGQASAFINTTLAYAQQYELGYSSTQNSTTSSLVASYTVPSGIGLITVNATNTATSPVDKLLAPNTHIVFNLSTTTSAGANQANGICSVRLSSVTGNGASF